MGCSFIFNRLHWNDLIRLTEQDITGKLLESQVRYLKLDAFVSLPEVKPEKHFHAKVENAF